MSALISIVLMIFYYSYGKAEMLVAAGLFGIAAELSCFKRLRD